MRRAGGSRKNRGFPAEGFFVSVPAVNRTLLLIACGWWPAFVGFAAAAPGVKDADARPVAPLSADLDRAGVSRHGERLVFEIGCTAEPEPERVRILVDADGPNRGEPLSGADYLVEGRRAFRYPAGAAGWTWDEIEPPLVLTRDRVLVVEWPLLPELGAGRWHVQTVGEDWTEKDRLPNAGGVSFDVATLPGFEPAPGVAAEPVGDLVTNLPLSLSFRFNAELMNKAWNTTPPAEARPPEWRDPADDGALPLRFALTDAASLRRERMEPKRFAVSGPRKLWEGETLGVAWQIVADPADEDGLRLTVQLGAEQDRCIRLSVGCDPGVEGWVWHDGLESARAISPTGSYSRTTAAGFGLRGAQSVLPFGVIERGGYALAIESEPPEPRSCEIVAEPGDFLFGIHYDCALTSGTRGFPGRAVFGCRLLRWRVPPGCSALRSFAAGRGSAAPSAPRRVADVLGALQGGIGKSAAAGISPWLDRWSLPQGLPATRDNLVRWLEFSGWGGSAEAGRASSALLCAVRGAEGELAVAFGRQGEALLEVNADPDFPPAAALPLTRAMAAWRAVRPALGDAGPAALLLAELSSLRSADYRPAALAASDVPCAFQPGALKPAVPAAWSAAEFALALAHRGRETGKTVLCDFALPSAAALERMADGFVERWAPPFDFPPEDLDLRRLLSGWKPFIVLLDGAKEAGGDELRRALAACLFWGFVPVLADDASAADPATISLFREYAPHSLRLAKAGWLAAGPVDARPAVLRAENFGGRSTAIHHVTIRGPREAPADGELGWRSAGEPVVAVDPLRAEVKVIAAEDGEHLRLPVSVRPGETAVLDLVGLPQLDEEIAFLRGLASGRERDALAVKALESVRAEMKAGFRCNLRSPRVAVRSEPNRFELEIHNAAAAPAQLRGLKIISSERYRPVDLPPSDVRPGETFTVQGAFGESDFAGGSCVEVQWVLRADGRDMLCARCMNPEWVEPVELRWPEGRLETADPAARLEMSARNNSATEQRLVLRWEGDFPAGRSEFVLPPRSLQPVRVEIRRGRSREGELFVEGRVGRKVVLRGRLDVEFRARDADEKPLPSSGDGG